MLSKEEILVKRIIQFPSTEEMEEEAIRHNVLQAMDEYAKQEAIEFYIWAQANGWSRYHGIDRWKNSDQKKAPKTFDELYPLYLKRIINATK